MKRTDLIEKLEDGGFIFERHGSGHDIYEEIALRKPFLDIERSMNN